MPPRHRSSSPSPLTWSAWWPVSSCSGRCPTPGGVAASSSAPRRSPRGPHCSVRLPRRRAGAPWRAVRPGWGVVQGFAGGGGIVLARAVAADLTTGVAAARLFSLFMTLSSVAPIIAPVLGGLLLVWTGSWPAMFHVLAVLNAVLAVAIWLSVPETLPPEDRD